MGELDQINFGYMKNRILILAIAAISLTSCYDDYINDYDRVACGFANPFDVRSIIVGETNEFSTGIALGGTIENGENRFISFETDYSLVNLSTLASFKSHRYPYIKTLMSGVSELETLPASLYTLETDGGYPGRALISKGSHLGQIRVKIDTAEFFKKDRLLPYSVIPLRIIDGNGTEIMSDRSTSVIGVRYENMLFGSYWHGGKTIVEKDGVNVDTLKYYTTVPQPDSKVWTLTTVAPYVLTANAVGAEYNGASAQMKIMLASGDRLVLSSVPGAKYSVEPDGESVFVRTKLLQDRKLILNYKYSVGDLVYHAQDTLYFRNRIRDGVNEWQDENPKNYE